MNRKKKTYLRLDNEKTKRSLKFKNPFFRKMIEGEMALNFPTFIALSLVSGLGMYLSYSFTTGSQIIAIAGGALCLSFPYLMMKTPLLLSSQVNNALAYKEYISILQSSLRTTNSTQEAIRIASEEEGIPNEIQSVMKGIVTDMRLGDSLEKAIDAALLKTENTYFKMSLTIIKINHKVGTGKTIAALTNIQKSMDSVIDNVQLLKDKINTVIIEKGLFLVLMLACPVIHKAVTDDITSQFYKEPIFQVILVVVLLLAFVGQFLIDNVAANAIKKL